MTPKNGATLIDTREVVLFFMEGLSKLKEIIQAKEFANTLVQTAAGQQPVLTVVHQQHLVDVVGQREWFATKAAQYGADSSSGYPHLDRSDVTPVRPTQVRVCRCGSLPQGTHSHFCGPPQDG